jgi:hypothetical protein
MHGKTFKESQERLRAKITQQVTQLYHNPPKLAQRYHKITTIPLKDRLLPLTKDLMDWLDRIKHQQKMTEYIRNYRPPGQLTLKQAFANHTQILRSRHAYPP